MAGTANVGQSPDDNHSRTSPAAHTLTACCRCRQRKTRCDAGLPRCGPCERNNAFCEYFDAAKGRKMPRTYVIQLQNRVRELENELAAIADAPGNEMDQESLVREGALVRVQDTEEPSFLGPSSGINMTRLVLELAKGIRKIKKIKDLIPHEQATRIRLRFEAEAQKPTSKDYPEISSVAAPNLPSPELTNMLVQNFFQKGQSLYPVLHQPSFRQAVQNVYGGSTDPYENFTVRMVVALGMQKLSAQWTGLADSYYLAALPFLESTIRARNVGTVQAFMLIAQYSMVTPTRTAANWIVGLAVKICHELGITQESTIGLDPTGRPLDPLEVDLRRRCFWVCASMELGLAHSMGRPSLFGMPHTFIDVAWFEQVDDEFITSKGTLPAPASPRKRIAKHFISMRLLQLEIRRTLYLKRREQPLNDEDPWFIQMEEKLSRWLATAPENSDGTPFSKEWFVARYNTIVVFLCRPSPQIPEPSVRAALRAFEASKQNIEVQRKQIDAKVVDLTWIFCQSLFMAINTVLWALSYADIRRENPRDEVKILLDAALETAYYASLKWPGVEGAIELYGTLQHTCLKAYDGEQDQSYSLTSPINRPSPATTASPEPLSSPLASEFNHQHISGPSSPDSHNIHPHSIDGQQSNMIEHGMNPVHHPSSSNQPQMPTFNPSSYNNPLPAINSGLGALAPENLYSPLFQPYTSLIGSDPEYPATGMWQNTQPMLQPMLALDLQQQSELMDKLEFGRMYGVYG